MVNDNNKRRERSNQWRIEQGAKNLLDNVQESIEYTQFYKLLRTGTIRPFRNRQELVTAIV